MRARGKLGIALVLALGGVAWLVLSAGPDGQVEEIAETVDDRAVPQSVRSAPEPNGKPVARALTAEATAPVPAVAREADPSETPSLESVSTRLARLPPDAYLRERRDEPWASQKEATIYDVLSRVPGGASSMMVRCATTLCRVEVVSQQLCVERVNEEEYTEQELFQLVEHQQIMMRIDQATDADTWSFTCTGEPGIYMTLLFDRAAMKSGPELDEPTGSGDPP